MRLGLAVPLVCGCNQVWGVEKTALAPPIDAQFFDAPADAPFACPPIGETPQFARLLNQIAQDCDYFTASAANSRAAAECREPVLQIAEGPMEGPFIPVAGLEPFATGGFDLPRMTPEGDELLVRRWDVMAGEGKILVYRRQPGDTFSEAFEVSLGRTTSEFISFGTPSAGPRRRLIVHETVGQPLEEFEFDSTGAAVPIATYTAADLGLDAVGRPVNLTPDGLRAVFPGGKGAVFGIMYTDRPSLTARFRPADVVPRTPYGVDAFLTEDCARLYFHTLSSILWLRTL